jgi:putative lipoic acid-binding regulatory protein
MENNEEFYKKLKVSLENTTKFPTEYMFKFIIPTDEAKVIEIKNIFNYSGVIINTKPSKTGKYKSLTIVMVMKDADEIIKKYKEVACIEGVISL